MSTLIASQTVAQPPTGAESTSPSKPKAGSAIFSHRITWTLLALVLLILINVIKDPSFLKVTLVNGALHGPLITILITCVPYMMIGVGMTIVVSTGGIDLTVGSIMAVSGSVAMTYMSRTGSGGFGAVLVGVGLALVVAIAFGAINGYLVSQVGLQPFITTLIMMLAVRGIAKTITGGQNISINNSPLYSFIGTGTILGLPAPFIIGTIIVLILALIIRKTALGMMIESVGINKNASRMAGLNPKVIIFAVYVISAVLACFGGVFITGYTMTVTPAQTGWSFEMYAILAVVIGGTSLLGGKFSLAGAYVGAIIISLITTTIVWLGVSNQATPAFTGAVVIVICVLQSNLVHKAFANRRKKQTSAVTPAAEASLEVAE